MFYQEKDFLDGFIHLIKECNKIILEVYNSNFDVILKKDESPLTIADKRCNDHICDYLEKLSLPNCCIISEENRNQTYEERSKFDWVWLVDPLDGTKEFVKRNGQFTVNIGLCQNKIPVFGIVSIPVTGEIYYGIKDVGSFKLHGLQKSKLIIPAKKFDSSGLRIVASASHLNKETEMFINQFNNPNIVNTGSSIKLLWIAENKADLYPRIAPTSEWDTCAAHAVVKYANGKVLQFNSDITTTLLTNSPISNKDNKEVEYNKSDLLNPYFIVL